MHIACSFIFCIFHMVVIINVCTPLERFFFLFFKGNNPTSGLEKEIGTVQLPANEHYFGLVNVSLIT